MPEDWLVLYERVAAAGFPVLLFMLLVGSYLDIWGWGKTHRRDLQEMQTFYEIRIKEWQERSEKMEARSDSLQDTLLRVSGILEQTATKFVGKRGI